MVCRSQVKTQKGGLSAFGFNMAALDYGCHCSAIINGQYHGHGQAVDPLDSVCKEYLGCIRCVKKQTQCEKIDVSIKKKLKKFKKKSKKCLISAFCCRESHTYSSLSD